MGINPYLVIVPGHAYLAWDSAPLDSGLSEMNALETTMIGNSEFADAWGAGIASLTDHWDAINDENGATHWAIDVRQMRVIGVEPVA